MASIKAWVRLNGGSWFPSGDPASGTGGVDLSVLSPNALGPIVSISGHGAQTFNFGNTGFSQSVPAGYTSGWPGSGSGGFTAFDPSKLDGTGALSNNNRTFTQSASFGPTFCQIPTADMKTSGKFYYEQHFDVKTTIIDFFGGGIGRAFPGLDYPSFSNDTTPGKYGSGVGPSQALGGVTVISNYPNFGPSPTHTIFGALATIIDNAPPSSLLYDAGNTLCWAINFDGSGPPPGTRTTGLSEMFFSPTAGFVDFTDPANLAKFATEAGCTVGIGVNGTGPFGIAPPVFFNQAAGSPANQWAVNEGTGGNFVLTGNLVAADGPCCGPGQVNINTQPEPVVVYLRWSDNRGKSYGNPMGQTMGATGEYLTVLQWNRLGMARDRVYELYWSATNFTTLQGAFLDPPIKLKS